MLLKRRSIEEFRTFYTSLYYYTHIMPYFPSLQLLLQCDTRFLIYFDLCVLLIRTLRGFVLGIA